MLFFRVNGSDTVGTSYVLYVSFYCSFSFNFIDEILFIVKRKGKIENKAFSK